MKRKPLVILGAIVAVLLIVVVALPFLIDVNKYKPILETNISTALGRKVEIGNISLSILSGGVAIQNVSIADDPKFSGGPFLQAKELKVGVNLLPLIFSKKIEVTSFSIDTPEVTLLKSPAGQWNFSTLGSGAASKSSGASSSANDLSVQKLTLSHGKLNVTTTGPNAKSSVYEDVNLEASDLSYTSQFPFQFSAKGPGDAAFKLDGKAGPINSTDTSLTPLDAKLDVQHLNLATTGFLDPSAGIAGIVDFNGTLTSDGTQMISKGTLKADKLKVSAGGAPSTVPLSVNYETDYAIKPQTGELKQGDIHIGKALARLTGAFNNAGKTPSVQMKLNGQNMSVPDLEGILPAVGVVLPSGSSLKEGTLTTNLDLSGPVDKLVVTGPVNLSNGKLTGFSLGSKLSVLQTFTGHTGGGGSGSDTVIQSLTTTLRSDPSGTHADNLNMVVPSIGTITGNGFVSSSGQLDCKMSAQLGSSQASAIPFKVSGTTKSPTFIPDAAALVGNIVKGNPATSALGGLFGKKKSK